MRTDDMYNVHVVCGTHTGIDEAHVPRVWDLVHILEGI